MARNTILITGVSRGIGKALATRAAADGYEVIGISRSPAADFPGTHYAVDLGHASAKEALREIGEKHGPCRLVANAGVIRAALVEDVTDGDFDLTMRTNLQSVIWAVQAMVPAMRAEKFGRIVTVGSRAALGKLERSVYGSSKAAIVGLTRTLALELGPDGVTVNCIAPGPIDTELFAQNQPEGSDIRNRMIAQVPVRRVGTPEDIAEAAAYFLSDNAGFTTGQVMHVCGGLSVGGMVG
ncbi:MAG: SDR family oxidoreductase [Alphaproteobacteria bacterium]|nr:SDR family oxidoreductase [Alphaproteobacteria bacterium]